jgi:histidinol-phosphatase
MTDPRTELARSDIENFHAVALELADEARSIIRTMLGTGFNVVRKPDGSFVTGADFRVEERLRELIEKRFPGHGILGEEYAPRFPDAPFQWILDPIDGTEEFVQRLPTFGSIIALHYRGLPVAGVIDHPVLEMRVSAAYGLGTYRDGSRVRLTDSDPATVSGSERVVLSARANFVRHRDHGRYFDAITRTFPNHRIYRSCFNHTCAVIGAADGAVDYDNRIWDIAASRILIEEAGGMFVTVREDDLPGVGRLYGTVFGKPAIVDRLVTLLK